MSYIFAKQLQGLRVQTQSFYEQLVPRDSLPERRDEIAVIDIGLIRERVEELSNVSYNYGYNLIDRFEKHGGIESLSNYPHRNKDLYSELEDLFYVFDKLIGFGEDDQGNQSSVNRDIQIAMANTISNFCEGIVDAFSNSEYFMSKIEAVKLYFNEILSELNNRSLLANNERSSNRIFEYLSEKELEFVE